MVSSLYRPMCLCRKQQHTAQEAGRQQGGVEQGGGAAQMWMQAVSLRALLVPPGRWLLWYTLIPQLVSHPTGACCIAVSALAAATHTHATHLFA